MPKPSPPDIKSVEQSKKASDNAKTHIALEQIRQAGICNYYDKLRQKGLSASQCIDETKIFARHKSYRATKDLLAGQIQPTGIKESSFSKYLKAIEDVKWELARTGSVKKGQNFPDIQRAIERDAKLDNEEKKALISDIENSIKEVDELSRKINVPTPEPRFKSVGEAIKNIDIE
jgi:hypothetical protein